MANTDPTVATYHLTVGQRGVVTLPTSLRRQHGLKPETELDLVDLGGVFVLSRRHPQIDALADRIASSLYERGETLESMMAAVREERARYQTEAQPSEGES